VFALNLNGIEQKEPTPHKSKVHIVPVRSIPANFDRIPFSLKIYSFVTKLFTTFEGGFHDNVTRPTLRVNHPILKGYAKSLSRLKPTLSVL